MTSEKKLREYARAVVGAERLRDDAVLPSDFPDLTDTEFERLCEIVAFYPILDLPVPDRDGCLWPAHGRNYACVRRGTVYQLGDPVPGVVVVRGGPGESSRHTSIALTREEALELASLLTAAALEEA